MSVKVIVFTDGQRNTTEALELDLEPDAVVVSTDSAGNVFVKEQTEAKTISTVLIVPRELFVRLVDPEKVTTAGEHNAG